MTTSGADSPGIYSTGAITVSGTTISATGSEAAVIEGENFITLTNTALSGAKKRGVMIYQSMSGDATAAIGPLFYVTNSTGLITLTGVTVTAAAGTLINAAAGNWGTSGSNGGKAIFTANGQTLSGDLTADSISSITLNAVFNSAWYYLWVSDTTGDRSVEWYSAAQADCDSGTGTCSVSPVTAFAAGSGKWWIDTWNPNGYGQWSDGMAFTLTVSEIVQLKRSVRDFLDQSGIKNVVFSFT